MRTMIAEKAKEYVQGAVALIILTIAAVFLSLAELIIRKKPIAKCNEGDEYGDYSWII